MTFTSKEGSQGEGRRVGVIGPGCESSLAEEAAAVLQVRNEGLLKWNRQGAEVATKRQIVFRIESSWRAIGGG